MDQITHEMRLADWQTIVTNCLARPVGQTKKQWLAEHAVPEKSYYYWQSKVRMMAYDERKVGCESHSNVPATYEFAELPFNSLPKEPREEAVPAAIIRKGDIVVELNNSVTDHLLGRVLEVLGHA